MIDPSVVLDTPPRDVPRAGRPSLIASVGATVRARSRIVALTGRDFRARYKQTALGFGWAIVLPVLTLTVFSLFVQRFARSDTRGVPYPLWCFLGLWAWTFFASAANNGSRSLLNNQQLLNKVYAARQMYPVAAVCLSAIDAAVSLGVVAVAFVVFGYVPSSTIYWLPVAIAVLVVFALAIALLLSIVVVYVRDLATIVPVVLQLGLFATPVVYALSRIPPEYRLLYCIVNPVAAVIETIRRAALYDQPPPWSLLGAAAASAATILLIAMWVFARFERGIVDSI